MRKLTRHIILLTLSAFIISCNNKTPDDNRVLVAELNNNFFYLDELEAILPPGLSGQDSTEFADLYIRKWATDLLMYDKAVQNTSNPAEIERMVNDYKKTLTVHQYQQKLLEQQRAPEPSEEEMIAFYEAYKSQMILKENMLKGLLLVLPKDAPNMAKVKEWVNKGDQESIENIDKYSLQNAISYDYFMDKWIPLTEIIRKTTFTTSNPTDFITTNKVIETTDSTHHYFLRVDSYVAIGQTEPYEVAKDKIRNILTTKYNAEYISNIETGLYKDAVAKQKIKIYKP